MYSWRESCIVGESHVIGDSHAAATDEALWCIEKAKSADEVLPGRLASG